VAPKDEQPETKPTGVQTNMPEVTNA